jgi:hypothetical protein
LIALENSGLQLNVNGKLEAYKIFISCFTGDNLFLKCILDFVESFSANHPCRHCLVQKSAFMSTFTETKSTIGSTTMYDESVLLNFVSSSGIEERCALNKLSHFHAANNFVQDIIHYPSEGVCLLDMRLVCKQLIGDDDITLADLNNRIQSFNYGYHDINQSPVIEKAYLDSDQLSMEAIQAWCFVRIFSLALGDIIKDDGRIWIFYLHLRQIMDIICAPSVHRQELDLLRVLISEYISMRVLLFPQDNLKNKHYNLIHYPRLIEESGPFSRLGV